MSFRLEKIRKADKSWKGFVTTDRPFGVRARARARARARIRAGGVEYRSFGVPESYPPYSGGCP